MKSFLMSYNSKIIAFFPQFISGLIVFILFYFASLIVRAFIKYISNHSKRKAELINLMADTAKSLVIVIGLISALGSMGINVSALLTSLGLAGFAVGLAVKEPLGNMIAGFMVLYNEPFKKGDFLDVDGKNNGKVKSVNLRYTVLCENNDVTMIPNSTVLKGVLKVSKNPIA